MKKLLSIILTAVVLTVIMTILSMTATLGTEQNKTGITAETTGIITETGCETLDSESFDSLRIYYNKSLSDEELFDRYVNLKKSYITALDNLYGAGTLDAGSNQTETAVHIFYEDQETLFGLDSSVYLYNIAVYKGLEKIEQTWLSLLVPVHSTNSVVTVNLIIPQEQLGNQAADNVAAILSDIAYNGLAPQNEAPSVLKNTELLEKVKAGIYPAASQESPVYTVVEDSMSGYTVSLPDSYVPFISNRLGGILTYAGYKIDPNQIFSIASQPLKNRQEAASALIEHFTKSAPDTMNILESGDVLCGSNRFSYVYYRKIENDVETWYYDYYMQNDARLYRLQLKSSFSEPGAIVLGQIEKILTSFQAATTAEASDETVEPAEAPDTPANASVRNAPAAALYENREEGYSFQYPQSWKLDDVSPGIDYDRLRLSVPGHSGTIEIILQESPVGDTAAFGTPEYLPPIPSKTSKLLFSDHMTCQDISTVYSLGAYVDDNGRNRLFSSVDILRGTKIYSLYISAGEYRIKDGYFDDEDINKSIDLVISSFRVYDTPKSEARALAGETRNRKLVFLENTLRNLYDPYLVVIPAENTQPDGTTIVAVENSCVSGFYKVKLDYPARKAEVLERVLKRDILQTELARICKQFDGLTITNTYLNEAKMTVSIEIEDKNNTAGSKPVRVLHTFAVNARPKDGKIIWNTVKAVSQAEYIAKCKAFVSSKFKSDVDVYLYGSNPFNDVDVYLQKGVDYRILAFYQGSGRSGFFMLSMNPATGVFSARKSFIPLTYIVEKAKYKYGINITETSPDLFCFDPETFTLNVLTSESTACAGSDPYGSAGSSRLFFDMRQFNVYYNPESDMIEFANVTSPEPETH